MFSPCLLLSEPAVRSLNCQGGDECPHGTQESFQACNVALGGRLFLGVALSNVAVLLEAAVQM